MQRLAWATRGPAQGAQRAWYDRQEADCTKRLVLAQPDPGHDGFLHHNSFMRCGRLPALCRCSQCAAVPLQSHICCLFHNAAAAYDTWAQLADFYHSLGGSCKAVSVHNVSRCLKTAIHAAGMCCAGEAVASWCLSDGSVPDLTGAVGAGACRYLSDHSWQQEHVEWRGSSSNYRIQP